MTETPSRDAAPADTIVFFETLYGALPDGALIVLWTLPDRRTHRFASWRQAAEQAANLAPTHDVYVAVGIQDAGAALLGPNRRGEAADVIGIVGLWADVDYDDPAHTKAHLPPDEASARALLNALPIPPTLVVHSGHGLQAWWGFREPYLFEDEKDRAGAQHIAHGWHARLASVAASRGWAVDAVWDISRVLRVPGTLNHKRAPAVPVRLLEV